MTTAQDIVSGMLRKIGVVAAGETPSAEDAADALFALNTMVDSWRLEQLMIYNYVMNEFDLVNGQSTYTLGSGGDFNIPRPDVLYTAKLRTPQGSQNLDLPLAILNQQQYAALLLKSTPSTIPGAIFMDGGYPLRNVFVWPVPLDNNNSLLMWLGTLLQGFSSLSDEVSLPVGYARALIYNGAVECAPEFGKAVPPAVAVIAAESKANIKRQNTNPLVMQIDPRITMTNRYMYNIYQDSP